MSHLSGYAEPILIAFLLFIPAAGLFTLPFMISNYRKYGGIALMRVLIVYSFILYSMCAFLLTVLPLPSIQQVAQTPPRPIGWIPFHDLAVGLRKAGVTAAWTSLSAWKTFLRSSDLFQILANIVMQVPLGFYLRYYFRCSWKKTVVIGFCVSLFYELTQLSGLFFIYPHAYRYTEVDDLINNTLGAMIGYWITPLLAWALPTRDQIDRISYQKGEHITLIRRLLAAMLDIAVFQLLALTVWYLLRLTGLRVSAAGVQLPVFLVYFVLIPWLTHGRTTGQTLLRIRVVTDTGAFPTWSQLLKRNVLLYILQPFVLFLNFLALLVIMMGLLANELDLLLIFFFFVLPAAFITACAAVFLRCQIKWGTFPHARWSRTMCVKDEK